MHVYHFAHGVSPRFRYARHNSLQSVILDIAKLLLELEMFTHVLPLSTCTHLDTGLVLANRARHLSITILQCQSYMLRPALEPKIALPGWSCGTGVPARRNCVLLSTARRADE